MYRKGKKNILKPCYFESYTGKECIIVKGKLLELTCQSQELIQYSDFIKNLESLILKN